MKLIITGVVSLWSTLLLPGYAQTPSDNPYQSRYETETHWTDDLHWDQVVNVLEVSDLVSDEGILDSLILHQTMADISKRGGGVVYFPAGSYKIDFRVFIPDGVILRGEDPLVADAQNQDYLPLAKLLFPRLPAEQIKEGISRNSIKGITGSAIHDQRDHGRL